MNVQDTMGIPVIDPNVQYVGVSKLRTLNADKLGSLDKTLVIQDDDKPLAVVLSYRQFLAMQKERGRSRVHNRRAHARRTKNFQRVG